MTTLEALLAGVGAAFGLWAIVNVASLWKAYPRAEDRWPDGTPRPPAVIPPKISEYHTRMAALLTGTPPPRRTQERKADMLQWRKKQRPSKKGMRDGQS